MSADVAIRLGLKGGTEVERGLKQVGREGKLALKELQDAAKGLPPHMVAVSRGVGMAKDSIEDLARRAPGGLGAVATSFGLVGTMVAALTVGVGLLAVAMARGAAQAAQYADDLDAMANKVGVSVEELQRWRDIGKEVDVETGAMDDSLRGLNATLGAFKSGVGDGRVKEAFAYLGFTPEQVKGFKDANDFLPVLADRIAAIADKAERVKLAKMFGVEEMLPVLELGSAGIRRYGEAFDESARKINPGMVEAMASSNREMEKADDALKATSTTFFGQFVPALTAAKSQWAGLFSVGASLNIVLNELGRQADQDSGKLFNMADAARAAFNWTFRLLQLPIRVPTGAASGPSNPGFDTTGMDLSGGQSPRQGAIPGSATPEAVAAWREANKPDKKGGGASRAEAERKRAEAEKKRSAELAIQNAERLRAIELENRLSLAKATGQAELVKTLETETAIRALTLRYVQAGLDADRARIAAQIQINLLKQAEAVAVDQNPDGFESSVSRMDGVVVKAKIVDPNAIDWVALRGEFRASFGDGVREALRSGDIGAALADQVENAFVDGVERSLDRLADLLFTLFEDAAKGGFGQSGGGSSGAGVFSQIGAAIASFFGGGGGGGRASGGPVWRGWRGSVNERGLESVTATSAGYVHDAATTARRMIDSAAPMAASSDRGGPGGMTIPVTLINQSGTPLRAEATERRNADGSRGVDVRLKDLIAPIMEERIKGLTRGGQDDGDMARGFGVRRTLTGG